MLSGAVRVARLRPLASAASVRVPLPRLLALRRQRALLSASSNLHPHPRRTRLHSSAAAASMATKAEVLRTQYAPLPYHAKTVELDFELGDVTAIKSKVAYVTATPAATAAAGAAPADLVLDGDRKPAHMQLVKVLLNGAVLDKTQAVVNDAAQTLTIAGALLAGRPENVVEVHVTVEPAKNTGLNGLYQSSGNFCTQCEAEGFRNLMYFLDRPDNMSTYSVRVAADKAAFPVLLSNGNDVESGELAGGRHFVRYDDPWPKPCYLFALVAGDFDVLRDSFTTRGGAEVALGVHVEKGCLDQTQHCMASLKKAMRWDEDRFDREYDLSCFNIVAVSDFNMGAMENKGLNVFNTKYVLAKEDTATDDEFLGVEAVVAHEYFHNWSGNRVTCRDWFQLTLKEGLTVFRDQEFTSDLNSRTVKRIDDVRGLRQVQFPEDSGPMAHSIRPDSYLQMDNMYTATVYEKGAEVVRMVQTVVGVAGFKKGLNLYFERHDGCAVTCEEFLGAMEDANQVDLAQFRQSWYFQAGTPELRVRTEHDAAAQTLTLHVSQSCAPSPGQPSKAPFDIPFAVAVLGADSRKPLAIWCADVSSHADVSAAAEELVLRVTAAEQSFVLRGVSEAPVPSLLRGYSAPVKLVNESGSTEQLLFLAAHDTDEFVRYESGQALAKQVLLASVQASVQAAGAGAGAGAGSGSDAAAEAGLHADASLIVQCLRSTLADASLDKALVALALALPTEMDIVEAVSSAEGAESAESAESAGADVDAILGACRALRELVATELFAELSSVYAANRDPVASESAGEAVARRALKNACLRYLVKVRGGEERARVVQELAMPQFDSAANMTDRFGAMLALRDVACPERQRALDAYYALFKDDKLAMQKWLRVQATSALPDTVGEVERIMQDPVFDMKNPNCCNSTFRALGGANFAVFHARSGEGYRFLADRVLELDPVNAQVTARIAKSFSGWRALAQPWRGLMKEQLERIAAQPELSPDTFEVVHKSLASPQKPTPAAL